MFKHDACECDAKCIMAAKAHGVLWRLVGELIDCLQKFIAFDSSGARVLASLHNLVTRTTLLQQCRESRDASERLLGPLNAFDNIATNLCSKHSLEIQKQQRNLVTVVDALKHTQQSTIETVNAMHGCCAKAGLGPSVGSGTDNRRAGPTDEWHARSPDRPCSIGDFMQLSKLVLQLIVSDMTRKIEALAVTGSLERLVDQLAVPVASDIHNSEEHGDGGTLSERLQAMSARLERSCAIWSSLEQALMNGSGQLPSLIWRVTGKPAISLMEQHRQA